MSDTTGLPPMSQSAKLALAGLDDEDVVYQLALVSLLTFNRFSTYVPEQVTALAVKVFTHALLETSFTRDPIDEPVRRKITEGLSPMPENIRLEVAGLNDEDTLIAATMSGLEVLVDPETEHVTVGEAAALLTHTVLELGFHR